MHLPRIAFFDATQSGVLISRVMSDAEGVRKSDRYRDRSTLLGGLVSAPIGIVLAFLSELALTTLVNPAARNLRWCNGLRVLEAQTDFRKGEAKSTRDHADGCRRRSAEHAW
jgi:hypothetical protein